MNNKYRFEKKYFIPLHQKKDIEILIKSHPLLFRSQYPDRYVNNIYFDTFDFENYLDNIDGSNRRKKFRIRWYGNLFSKGKAQFEIKKKRGFVGDKKTINLKHFSLSKYKNYIEKVQKSIPNEIKLMRPTLLNRYLRSYFISADNRFRLTVDTQMEFFMADINKISINKREVIHGSILELKYTNQYDENIRNLFEFFNFRQTKFSKYANGIHKIYF